MEIKAKTGSGDERLIRRVDLLPQYQAHRPPIQAAINRVLESGRYTLADEVKNFEAAFCSYLGANNFVAVGDGTRAITLVLRHLGIGAGDDVVTVPFTAFPTIAAIIDTGARPVFADICRDSYLLTAETMLAAITERTRAVIAVHIFGNVVDIPAMERELSRIGREDIVIIEDSAQAHGSSLDGRLAGSLAPFSTFSFYPTKNLGGYGDGGGIACRSEDAADKLRRARNYGFIDKDTVLETGINSRLDELQAAILMAKLPFLNEMNASRRKLADLYAAALPELGFSLQSIGKNVVSNWHVYEPCYQGDRGALIAALEKCGIQANVYYVIPHHLQPALTWLGYRPGDLPGVEHVCSRGIALPLYPELEEADVAHVIDSIRAYVC